MLTSQPTWCGGRWTATASRRIPQWLRSARATQLVLSPQQDKATAMATVLRSAGTVAVVSFSKAMIDALHRLLASNATADATICCTAHSVSIGQAERVTADSRCRCNESQASTPFDPDLPGQRAFGHPPPVHLIPQGV